MQHYQVTTFPSTALSLELCALPASAIARFNLYRATCYVHETRCKIRSCGRSPSGGSLFAMLVAINTCTI
eukprot:2362051-Amphidinium_carterae.2